MHKGRVIARLTLISSVVMYALTGAVHAEIKIGAILSLTGPGASLGLPEQNTINVLPTQIAGEPVRYVIIDDASDPSAAVRAAQKLIGEERVDVILGPSLSTTSFAVIPVIAAGKTAMLSPAGSAGIARPVEGDKIWSFKPSPEERHMAARIFGHMKENGRKTVGFIGFNDAFGDNFIGAFKTFAPQYEIEVVADERYAPRDTSATAQALKVMAVNPDAIIIGASGTPAVTPILELRKLGYQGAVYVSQGMASPEVLSLGGADLNGVIMSVAPALVADQLPDGSIVKTEGLAYMAAMKAKYGEVSPSIFGSIIWDAFKIIEAAVPKAMQQAKPGTQAFREALRLGIEGTTELVGAQGVFTMSASDHIGMDERSQVLVRVENGSWVYLGQ
jgi:branched-chain amino acid transport system substrate-binding protein